MMSKTIWIVKGDPITQSQIDDGCYPQTSLGKTEWQFSDGPMGKRTYSEDYDDIEEGMNNHQGYTFIREQDQ
jgi:hypothetical protein